jgi:hypothetical protein
MKKQILSVILLSVLTVLSFSSCTKESSLVQNQKYIKKLWKLDKYLINAVDKTAELIATNYEESYQDDGKYDRSFDNRNGVKVTQNGAFEFENATRLKISGVGSVEMTNNGTVSSSYYNIIKLSDTELWYSFVNGNATHEFRLSRK